MADSLELFFSDFFDGELLFVPVVEAEDDFGVADGEAAIADVGLKVGGEFEEAHCIGDDGAAFADFGGGFFLGQFKLFDQLRIAQGFFDRR